MAEALLKLKGHVNPDPTEDRRGAYKRGMIVAVQGDGFDWGRPSITFFPAACIVKIPGLAVIKLEELISPQVEDDAGVSQYEDDGVTPKTYRRRRWKLLVDDVPQAMKAAIRANGEVTVTPTQVRNFIKRHRDNAQYTGMD